MLERFGKGGVGRVSKNIYAIKGEKMGIFSYIYIEQSSSC